MIGAVASVPDSLRSVFDDELFCDREDAVDLAYPAEESQCDLSPVEPVVEFEIQPNDPELDDDDDDDDGIAPHISEVAAPCSELCAVPPSPI